MQLEELRRRFQLPDVAFDDQRGLVRVTVKTPAASGSLFLHGAHCAEWRPAGHAPVLWMSQESFYQADKPIRGGVPICFPWFGPNAHDKSAPAHGLARLKTWELVSIDRDTNDTVHLKCSTRLAPFELTYVISFGPSLTLSLTTHLPASHPTPERFEDALHTYLAVNDIHKVKITGLEQVAYIDKVDQAKTKPATGAAIEFTGETDRVYQGTTDTCILHDPIGLRQVIVSKQGSKSTIVWNPWIEKSARMPDFGDNEWPGMLCIETANVGDQASQLRPGEKHTTTAHIEVASL